MADAASEGRRYGGASAAERRADRRERLIRAAIDLYGERGYRRTTVSAVCQAARLTPRYFYETFDNSEALLAATFRGVRDFLTEHVALALAAAGGSPHDRLEALLVAYYELLRAEPASARVFLSEISGIDPVVDRLFDRSTANFADLIARTLDPAHVAGTIDPLRSAGAMHGLLAIARDWVGRGCQEPIPIVVETAEPLCYMLAGRRQSDRA